MALVTQSIKNLKGGISQQPEYLRYAEQGAQQVNGWSSEVEGLQKRPPSLFTKSLPGDLGAKPLVHLINRDQYEQYYVVFTGTSIRAFELDGTEKPVRSPHGFWYVDTQTPREDLRMVTVADYTFIVNRKVTVSENLVNVSHPGFRDDKDCLINIRGGQYGRTLKVWINGQQCAEVALPDGGAPEHSKQVAGAYIASQLRKQMTGTPPVDGDIPAPAHVVPLPASWQVLEGAGFVHVIAPADDNIRSFDTDDGFANQLISPVTHYTQSFSKLPINAPNGYLVKITGDTSKTSDAYYIEYDSTQKVWKETVGWGTPVAFEFHTLPWTLVRDADGGFTFAWHEWATKKSGDADTNPFPSISGSTINDVFFYRNRLGFLSGENVVMSQTGKYFNLFPLSVANLADDDPLDVAVSHNRISILKYAVPFSEEMLLWSDQAQFVLNSQGVLSAKTADLSLTTEFDVSDYARPFGIGRGVHFATPRTTYSSLSRYYAVQDTSAVKSAEDISKHVPQYIPNGVFSIHGSGTENFVSVLTEGAPSKVFIYKYLYQDEQLVQQSWSHWDFGPGVEILAASSIGSSMFLLMRNSDNSFMMRVNFTKHNTDWVDEPYQLHLDAKVSFEVPPGTYNDDWFTTTVPLWPYYSTRFRHGTIYAVESSGALHEFPEPSGGWPDGNATLVFQGNLEGARLFVGFSYEFLYEFSKFLIKKQDDAGGVSTEDAGRLQLRRAWVNYSNTGAFTVSVANGAAEFRYDVSGELLGWGLVGNPSLDTSQYRFPVNGNAVRNKVTLTSRQPTPLSIIGCGWEGTYMRRASGI